MLINFGLITLGLFLLSQKKRSAISGHSFRIEDEDHEIVDVDLSKIEPEYDQANEVWETYGKATVYFKDGTSKTVTAEQLATQYDVYIDLDESLLAKQEDHSQLIDLYQQWGFDKYNRGKARISADNLDIQIKDTAGKIVIQETIPHGESLPEWGEGESMSISLRVADHGWTPQNSRRFDSANIDFSVVTNDGGPPRHGSDFDSAWNQHQIFLPDVPADEAYTIIVQQLSLFTLKVLPQWIREWQIQQ